MIEPFMRQNEYSNIVKNGFISFAYLSHYFQQYSSWNITKKHARAILRDRLINSLTEESFVCYCPAAYRVPVESSDITAF